ncbi:MAG: amidohydrolase family protein, partial [Planctomycetes bacterium]|nr:amidohydrolase family protein [Planctomycetota bacterium]
ARSGYTTLACLPDTDPPIDTESAVEYVHLQGERAGGAEVFAIAAMTKGRKGESLAEIGQLAKAGALAFSDCQPVEDADVLLKGLKYASMFGKRVIDVPRDPHLGGGVMNAGLASTLAGLSGSPAVAEELAVVRGTLLAREANGAYHAAHVSTVGAIKRMQEAKEDGIDASAAVAPYNILMTEDLVREHYDTRFKLRPPLRRLRDIESVIFGLKIGAIDALISAHAPVGDEGKAHEFDYAPFGGSTLEATFSAACEAVVHRADLGVVKLVELASTNPARLLGLDGRKGSLRVGADGDVVLFDPNTSVKIDSRDFISKSHVCPYEGMTLRGAVRATVIAGKVFGA